jgi:cysteine desulfurase
MLRWGTLQTPTTLYLDHAATTPLRAEAFEAMRPYLEDRFANASSLYGAAREARKAIEDGREQIAQAVGARPEEVVFTGGGTEADNLAIKGASWHGREQGRDGIVVGAIEHHAVLDSARWLGRHGFRVTEVPVDRHGVVKLDQLKSAVDEKTALVSVMWANNEVGTIQPVRECAEIARAAGARFHTDAVQALPWLEVDAAIADLVALSAHKLGGPKGVGALIARRGVRLQPLLHGGGQERDMRSGTYNVAGIAGFGAAAAATVRDRETTNPRVRALRDRLQDALGKREDGVTVNGHPTERLPNNLNVCIEGVEGEPLILMLDGAGVAASSGSACTSGSTEPSHVLVAMGVPKRRAAGSLRLTLGWETTQADVDAAVEKVIDAVTRLRRR